MYNYETVRHIMKVYFHIWGHSVKSLERGVGVKDKYLERDYCSIVTRICTTKLAKGCLQSSGNSSI